MVVSKEVVRHTQKAKTDLYSRGQAHTNRHALILFFYINFEEKQKRWEDDIIPETVNIDRSGSKSNAIPDIPLMFNTSDELERFDSNC